MSPRWHGQWGSPEGRALRPPYRAWPLHNGPNQGQGSGRPMAFDFTGKRVLVAGGSRGIGAIDRLGLCRSGGRCVDLRPRRGSAGVDPGTTGAARPACACSDLRPGRWQSDCRLRRRRAVRTGWLGRAGQQRLGLWHGRRRSRLGRRPERRRDGDGACLARRAAGAAGRTRRQHRAHRVDLRLQALDALAGLCRSQGRDDELHRQPGRHAGAPGACA